MKALLSIKSVSVLAFVLLACRAEPTTPKEPSTSTPKVLPKKKELTLPQVRKSLTTKIFLESDKSDPAKPPAEIFELVKYPAPLGENFAYVTPKRSGEKKPAIVWIAGGTEWSIGADVWRRSARVKSEK